MKKLSDQELLKKYPDYKEYPKYGAYVSNKKMVAEQVVPEEDLDFRMIPGKKGDLVVAAGATEDRRITSKSFLKDLETSKDEIFSTLNIPQIEKRRRIVSEKLAKNLLKRFDFDEIYKNLPDLTNHRLGGVYMGLVSSIDREDGVFSICIGKFDGKPIEYQFSFKDVPSDKKYTKGDTAFIDLKKDGNYQLSDYFAFNKDRVECLEKMGIEINGDKIIHYKTKSGKLFKGKVVGLGQDVTGNQIVFQTTEGKKFPLSLAQLKQGMRYASIEHKKSQPQNNEATKIQVSKRKVA